MSEDEYSDVEDAQPVRKLGEKGYKKPKKPKKSAADGEPKKKGGLASKLPKVDKGYMDALANSEEVESLDVIMQKGSAIKADIAALEKEIATVQSKINRLRISDTFEGADDLRDELRSAHTLASKIRKDLAEFKDFKPDIPDGDRKFKPKHDETEGVVRMQRNLYVGLSQKFSSVLGEMTKVADSFQQVDKKPTDQYYKPGSGGYDDSDDDDMGSGGLQMQKQKEKKMGAGNEAEERAQRAYIYSKEVNQELRELEESIIQLHQLFVDISQQTAAQGELLGISEEAVRSASEQSSKALTVLQAAEQHVNAARKKFLAAVLIVIGVTVLIIAGIGACIAILAMLG